MISLVEFLGIPGTIATCIIAGYLIMQLIGELLEFKGKAVPEFMKIRKFFKRKKEEKQEIKIALEDSKNTLVEVKTLLDDVNSHYNNDNIEKRDNWMKWVNDETNNQNNSIKNISKKIDNIDTVLTDLYLESKRNIILNFAARVNNQQYEFTREHFTKIFKVYKEYEEYIEAHDLKNGEVDIAFGIIEKAYEYRLKNNLFID